MTQTPNNFLDIVIYVKKNLVSVKVVFCLLSFPDVFSL